MTAKNSAYLTATVSLRSTSDGTEGGTITGETRTSRLHNVFPGLNIYMSIEKLFNIDGDHTQWVNMDVDTTAANNILTHRVAGTVDADSRQILFVYNSGDTDIIIGMYDNSATTNHPLLYILPGEWAFAPFKFGQTTDYISASVGSGTGSVQYAIFEAGVTG